MSWCNIPADLHLQQHHCENLKFYDIVSFQHYFLGIISEICFIGHHFKLCMILCTINYKYKSCRYSSNSPPTLRDYCSSVMCNFLRYLPCSEMSMNTVHYVSCTCIGCICVHVFELQCIHSLTHTSLGQELATEWGKSVSAVQSENLSVKFEEEISRHYSLLGGDAL